MLLIGVVLTLAGLTIRGPASNVSTQLRRDFFDLGSAVTLLGIVVSGIAVLTYIAEWVLQ